jgi:sugar phosphate isomerase/epimerase
MCVADDPVQGVYTLKEYIVHTHAKDGVQLTADPITWEERPLGQGGVEWKAYLAALRDIGYNGFLTIERETGEHPDEDIAKASAFLREMLM